MAFVYTRLSKNLGQTHAPPNCVPFHADHGRRFDNLCTGVCTLAKSRSRVLAFADADFPLREALTSRFARLNDFLLQRVFRTLDQIELADEGTALDRLQRAEARGLISSAERWRELRLLRNAIAHDYLIESADRVLRESLTAAPELIETAECIGRYVHAKGYSGESSYRPLTP